MIYQRHGITHEFYVKKMSENALAYYNELKELSQKGKNFVHHRTPEHITADDKYHIKSALDLEGYFGASFDFGVTVIAYCFLEGGRRY